MEQLIFHKHDQWRIAQEWVAQHRPLILQTAHPFSRFISGTHEDLFQEAVIAAFKALRECCRKCREHEFIKYFRVIFKTQCRKLARGVSLLHGWNSFSRIQPTEEEKEERELSRERIVIAFSRLTERQKEICLWVLRQKRPATTNDIAIRFKITPRHARRIIQTSIETIQEMSA